MPKFLAPSSFRRVKACFICSLVIPYLASPGLSMTWKPSLLSPRVKVPPGLYRQEMVLGTQPRVS